MGLVWVFTVPIGRGTGGNNRTVMQTIPIATKEKENVQDRCDMRNNHKVTVTLQGQRAVSWCRSGWRSKDESEERSVSGGERL